uniref:Uncharacterized protein n=1 Tax=Rhizophora mucronata TaxID=61149 RepID=A0A2P2MTD1_RHIMU
MPVVQASCLDFCVKFLLQNLDFHFLFRDLIHLQTQPSENLIHYLFSFHRMHVIKAVYFHVSPTPRDGEHNLIGQRNALMEVPFPISLEEAELALAENVTL